VQPLRRDPNKFDALGRTYGWAPHNANAPGSQRAVYDPVSHKATIDTVDAHGGVNSRRAAGRSEHRGRAAVVNVDVPGVLYGELFLDLRPHELATAHRLQDAFFRFVQREDA
jgi:hypothetical protein